MAKIIGLPKLSPTMEEGTLVTWNKKEGDTIDVDDLLAEVETDKATMEFRSFDKGVLLKILVEEGQTLAPDTPVAIMGTPDENIDALMAEVSKTGATAATESAPAEPLPVETTTAEKATPQASSNQTTTAPQNAQNPGKVIASPLVRRMAREQNIDLSNVRGSGDHGRVIKRDLANITPNTSKPNTHHVPLPGIQPMGVGPDQKEPVSQMRKTIARRLTESKRDIPHYYLTVDVDVAPLIRARAEINAELEGQGLKISLNDLLIKACAVSLARQPDVNVSFHGDHIVRHQRVDISVAVAIPDGLITPVVRNANLKGVLQISQEVRELAKRAREKRLKPEEFTDGTFSISNLGMFGIDHFTAVINPPEGAILAVGQVREEPTIQNGELVAGKRMRMTLSCDHRVIDGAAGAQFLAVLRRHLESPTTLLL